MNVISQIVDDKLLIKANEIHSIIWSVTFVLGVAFGGIIVDKLGVWASFVIDAGLFFIAMLVLTKIQFNINQTEIKTKLYKTIKDGISYIKQNKLIKAHTLVLLDLDPFENGFLTPREALGRLLEIEGKRKEKVIDVNEKVIVCQRLGWKDEKIFYEKVKDFLETKWNKPPWCVIIPSDLNPIEKEFLENVRTPIRKI